MESRKKEEKGVDKEWEECYINQAVRHGGRADAGGAKKS